MLVGRYTLLHIEPVLIQIDASAHSQLACPACPTANGLTRANSGAGDLDTTRFRALLDANPRTQEVELSNCGEMLLDPRLVEILRIAAERHVVLHADNGVNLDGEEIEAARPAKGILLGVVVERNASEATHADVFVAPRSTVRPEFFVRPPQAWRIDFQNACPCTYT